MKTSELRLSDDLEDPDDKRSPVQWYADALRLLARELGEFNDFYFPLMGAAEHLDGKSVYARDRELRIKP